MHTYGVLWGVRRKGCLCVERFCPESEAERAETGALGLPQGGQRAVWFLLRGTCFFQTQGKAEDGEEPGPDGVIRSPPLSWPLAVESCLTNPHPSPTAAWAVPGEATARGWDLWGWGPGD